jgi:hypothetical protein
MDMVNLPPWMQTSLTAAGALCVLVPVVIHAINVQDAPWAKKVLQITADVYGFVTKRPL